MTERSISGISERKPYVFLDICFCFNIFLITNTDYCLLLVWWVISCHTGAHSTCIPSISWDHCSTCELLTDDGKVTGNYPESVLGVAISLMLALSVRATNSLYQEVLHLWHFIKPQESATQGSLIPISRQAQTKLEVCLYSFLWSPDAEAVLVAMSCFRHLCEEADIRCSVDELPVHTVLPNYNTFMEFASVSNMMATGQQ